VSILSRLSEIVLRIAVPFFGGFLGAIGVALVGYSLGVIGVSKLVGIVNPPVITPQGLQNISWGGAMWGFIPAAFLIAKRGNIYLVVLFTTIIAVTYGQFVLQHSPLVFSPRLPYSYVVNLTYAVISALTIKAAGLAGGNRSATL